MDRLSSNSQKHTYRVVNKRQGEVVNLLYPFRNSRLYTKISPEIMEKLIVNGLTNLKLRKLNLEHIPDEFKECLRSTIEKHRSNEKSLKSQVYRDSLTGIYNKGYLSEYLKRKFNELNRKVKNEPISCIMFDIDHFKEVNDTYGHETGDAVLKDIAQILESSCRSTDVVARYGGEEFTIVCPNTNRDGAYILAEKIRKAIESKSIDANGKIINCTISAGVACYQLGNEQPGSKKSSTKLIEEADQNLYEAKKDRNKVIA